jgi:hypothetical protein
MRFVLVAIALFVPAVAIAACVDGKTPDCSGAASQCGPDLDGEVPEASAEGGATDAPAGDAPADSPSDAAPDTTPPGDAADAGDAGDAQG